MDEFHKRVEAIWEERLKTQTIVTMQPEDFEKIVEDAKKELVALMTEMIEHEEGVYEDTYVQFYHRFKKEWFVRWFGGAENK